MNSDKTTAVDLAARAINKPIICAAGGIDPSGHAGLLADLRTLEDLGGQGVVIVSALTLQNSQAWQGAVGVENPNLLQQWQCLADDLSIPVLKVGLLTDPAHYQQLQAIRKQWSDLVIIQDPVAVPTLAASNLAPGAITAPDILPGCDLLTPNLPELSQLTGCKIDSLDDIAHAAQQCLAKGARAVLVKGGHADDKTHKLFDYYCDKTQSFWLENTRQTTPHSRGTGCVLASAIATFIAQGKAMIDAIVLAEAYVQAGLAQGFSVGKGAGMVAQTGWPTRFQYFPKVHRLQPSASNRRSTQQEQRFPACAPLGLYPVVDSLVWLERLLKAGIKTLQLRVKDQAGEPLTQTLSAAIALGRQHKAQVIINDYWQAAIALGAWGVHLGQEDLCTADLSALANAGIRLGISTHSEWEWCNAMAHRPSYIAFGAVFNTKTKPVKVIGLAQLKYWQSILGQELPTTAIGGINLDNIDAVLACGVNSVAVVTAITRASDPEAVSERLMAALNQRERV